MTSRVSQKVAVSVVYVAAMFMTIMDATIVNVALPTIGRSFEVASTSVASVSIYFLVSLAVFMSASGWLGDRFGGKRVLLTAIVVFTAASALCGMAGSLAELDVFRVLQGAGGGMMAPVGLAMLFRAFPPAERVRASSILTVPTTLAPALGPVVGGLLVTELSWRWVFYVNVPLGILAIAFGALFLQGGNTLQPGPFDTVGFVLAGASLGLLMYGVSEGPIRHWSSGIVQAAIAAGAILLLALVLVELRKRQPLIDLRLLGNRLFRSANGVMVLASASFIGTLYVVSLFFQDGRGMSALASGLSTFPEALGVMAGAQLASRALYPVLGPRRNIALGSARGDRLDRADEPDRRADEPVVDAAADVLPGSRDGSGLRARTGGRVRHHLTRGHRPRLDDVQRHPPARQRGRRCRAHHRHRRGRHCEDPGRPGRARPRRLPRSLPGGRRPGRRRRRGRADHP